MKSHNLMSVAEMAIAAGMGESLVFDEVAKALEGFETSEAHRMVSDFNWRLIATTNYDRFLEDAYGDTERRRQTLVPFVKDSEPVEDRMAAVTNPVQYLKLHGSIDHRLDKEVPLVLSWEHFDRYAMNRKRLFERLQYFAPESVIIFVGYRLGDAHIRGLIYALEGAERPRWYTVDPGAEDEDVAFWQTKNVEVLSAASLRQVQPPLPLADMQRIAEFFPSPGFEYQLDPSYEPTSTGYQLGRFRALSVTPDPEWQRRLFRRAQVMPA